MPPLQSVGGSGTDEMKREPKEMLHQPLSVATRLLSHCRREKRCWIWGGSKAKGYGQMKVRGKTQWVHRVSYACFNGVIAAGMSVNHLCRNTLCINPQHLELLTPENNAEHGNIPEDEKVPF